MILRILGEGQLEIPEAERNAVQELDDAVEEAVRSVDHDAFDRALHALLAHVRASGRPVAEDFLGSSDAVLPDENATLEEVAELLREDGLVPGLPEEERPAASGR